MSDRIVVTYRGGPKDGETETFGGWVPNDLWLEPTPSWPPPPVPIQHHYQRVGVQPDGHLAYVFLMSHGGETP